MPTKLLTNLLLIVLPFSILLTFPSKESTAQSDTLRSDSTSIPVSDSLSTKSPPAAQDTIRNDSLAPTRQSKQGIQSRVDYSADDSIRFNVNKQEVYLYENNEILYENIKLNADYVEINFRRNTVSATGFPDSTGQLTGLPVFAEGEQSFESDTMLYNFETKKGLIKHVITQDGEGYIHGEVVKRLPSGVINVKSGSYTTCDLRHPHFEFRYFRSKLIPDNKIVTGPAFLVISDVPTPLFIPFGLFPNKKGQRSGILIPTYGESAQRGFFFEEGGYYWAINDYMDLALRGDIYTKGSWAVKPTFRYKKRYKFNGSLNFNYAVNYLGDADAPDFEKRKDFALRWLHNQDPKARPNSSFSANVNILSSKYNQLNPTTAENYLSNTFNSSVNYRRSWANRYYLNLNLNHSQNTLTREVNLTAPQLSFDVNRIYPFRNQNSSGKPKWYEDISVQYSMQAENRINTLDTLLFEGDITDKFRNGIKHNIPIRSQIKVLNHFTMTNTINYQERWYTNSIRKTWHEDTLIQNNDTIVGYVETDTLERFVTSRDFRFSSDIKTMLYGMYQFRRGPVKAIRHVLTPSVGFSYTPNFGTPEWGYYKEVQIDQEGNTQEYSIFQNGIYGSPPSERSGRVNFSLSNNLEMKVRARNDTVTGTKKVVLIDQLRISTGYDLAKDSLNWDYVTLSGNTRLFKNLTVRYSSTWDPYALDSLGSRINKFEWDENRRLLRLRNNEWFFGLNLSLKPETFKRTKFTDEATEGELSDIKENPENYYDFSIPWRFNINYTLRYTNDPIYTGNERMDDKQLVQTLGFNGELNLTPKWKLNVRSGYDFENKDFSYTSVNVIRDLHCWEMTFNWIPYGPRKSWRFNINIKSVLLQDLKLMKKKDFRDNVF